MLVNSCGPSYSGGRGTRIKAKLAGSLPWKTKLKAKGLGCVLIGRAVPNARGKRKKKKKKVKPQIKKKQIFFKDFILIIQ
jgi:hypothetical protein